jgi:hypothetical protein
VHHATHRADIGGVERCRDETHQPKDKVAEHRQHVPVNQRRVQANKIGDGAAIALT